MKTRNNNIADLKRMINANEDNALNIQLHGAVVKEFPFAGNSREFKRVEKVNGRYYFVDVVGTRYAFNKFADLDALCEEFIERMADDTNAVVSYFMALQQYGHVTVRFELSFMFKDYCEQSGVNVAYVENSIQCVRNGNELYTIETYEVVGGNDSPTTPNEPKDEPKAVETADVEDLETVAPIRMYKVLRKADGTIKTKLVRRWSRFAIAYNSLKDHAEMAREKGINVQKVGAQYFVVNPSFGEGVVLMLYVCRGEIDEKKAARIMEKALPQLQTADPTTDAPTADVETVAPTADDPRKAGTFQDCNETDVISYFAELGLNVADGFYTDFAGRWSYTVGKEDPTAEINVPLTTGEYINISKAA